jgi:hypothetical protein
VDQAFSQRWLRNSDRDPAFGAKAICVASKRRLKKLERRRLLIVLDEAQHYGFPALEELRLLLGLNLPTVPCFGLILVGDDYLLESLKLRHHRALYSRIAAQVRMEPWTPEQAQNWIHQAWTQAGLSMRALEAAAVELLVKSSGGVPRSCSCWRGPPGSRRRKAANLNWSVLMCKRLWIWFPACRVVNGKPPTPRNHDAPKSAAAEGRRNDGCSAPGLQYGTQNGWRALPIFLRGRRDLRAIRLNR